MASIDMTRPSLDRAHQHTTFYLPAENLSQPFSSFSAGRFDTKNKQDLQQSMDFHFNPRDGFPSGQKVPESQEPAVTSQPGSSSLTTSLRKARSAEKGIDRKADYKLPLDVAFRPSDTAAVYEGPFTGEVSDLEDYQDPASSSNLASPSCSSDFSDFADCDSEGMIWCYEIMPFLFQGTELQKQTKGSCCGRLQH